MLYEVITRLHEGRRAALRLGGGRHEGRQEHVLEQLGQRHGAPLEVDEHRPRGRVDVALLQRVELRPEMAPLVRAGVPPAAQQARLDAAGGRLRPGGRGERQKQAQESYNFV